MRKSLLILDAVVFLDNRRLPSLQNLRTLYLQSDVKGHNVPSHLKHGPTKKVRNYRFWDASFKCPSGLIK